jgi:acetyltransferase
MLGDASSELFGKAVKICLEAKEVDGLLIMSAPQALTDPSETAAGLVDLIRDQPIPVFTSWVGGAEMQKGRDLFNQAGIPTFDTPERAVRAFMDIYRYSLNIEMLEQIPARLPRRLEFDRQEAKALVQARLETENKLLTEMESKELLSVYGIPVNKVVAAASSQEAVEMAKAIGFPVVLKINSRDITHKSDAKGVLLDLKNALQHHQDWGCSVLAIERGI